jgi:2-keto-4-pentenoate hydratase
VSVWKKVAALAMGVVAALFGGGEVGTMWALRLCAVAGETCSTGAAVLGGAFGFVAAVAVGFVGTFLLVESMDK